MRCPSCEETFRKTQAKSWSKWGICGECAIELFPEAYPVLAKSSRHNFRGWSRYGK